MEFRYFVAAVIWIGAVTATLESDSHGNWSNEKKSSEQNYGSLQREGSDGTAKEGTKNVEVQSLNGSSSSVSGGLVQEETEEAGNVKSISRSDDNFEVSKPQAVTKQVIQPYVLSLKARSRPEEVLSEPPDDVSRLARTSQNGSNETVTVEFVPSKEALVQDSSTNPKYPAQESGFNDLSQVISEENLDLEAIAEFGQRVRSSTSVRQRSNESAGRFRPRQQLESSSPFEDHRKQHRKSFRSYTAKKLDSSADSNSYASSKDRLPFTLLKTPEAQKSLKQGDYAADSTTKNSLSTPSPVSVSLGKFSRPIVVPDLPSQKKYSYTTTPDYTEGNEVTKPTVASVEAVSSKLSENSYLAASPIVLGPLQVGVALMNAGQDLNLVGDQVPSTKEYSQDEFSVAQISDVDSESLIQNDAPDSGNSSYQADQVSQQEQLSEVVALNSPSQSVEIQKSVEIFHTAPVQEIHYPVEFIPHVAQALVKPRPQEEQYRKAVRGQFKDQKAGQVNIYRSNEILDETIPSNPEERSRYEYTVNDNDVVYSASNGQTEQTVTVARPVEVNPLFGAKEQVDATQYEQTVVKHSRLPETPEESIKQGDYELLKGPSPAIIQSPRGIEGLPGLVNLESLQATQGIPQVLPTKPASEPPPELRLLVPASQLYSVEKTTGHVPPHPLDLIDKKMPFPVEKVIEKQIAIPQPFPVHIPVDRVVEKQIRIPYPVHVEKVIEKKVPFAIQRFIIPLPIHFRVPQPVPFPVEKVVEKPVPVPVPVEKVVEKPVHLSRPYSLEVEKSRPYSLESTKLVKSVPIYNIQNDGNYQQVIQRQNYQVPLGLPYGFENGEQQGYYNNSSSTQFYGSGGYLALNRPPLRQPLIYTLPKKFGSYGVQYNPHSVAYSVHSGNLGTYGRTSDKDKDEYVGPVPRKVQASLLGLQSKSLYSTPDIQATLRRTRQEGNTGNFRQSKMEYGFKPPMVPSVQYDEQTATKVE